MIHESNVSPEQIYNELQDAEHSFFIVVKGDDVSAYINGDSAEIAIAMRSLMEDESDEKNIDISEPLVMLADILIQEHTANAN